MKNKLLLSFASLLFVPASSNAISRNIVIATSLGAAGCSYIKLKSPYASAGLGLVTFLLLSRYTPQARLMAADRILLPYKHILLCTEYLSPDTENTVLEGSNCYDGLVTVPLINAS